MGRFREWYESLFTFRPSAEQIERAERILKRPACPDPEDGAMFIADREKNIGVVTAAEIYTSMASGRRMPRLPVAFDAVNSTVCIMTRQDYTLFVIRTGRSSAIEAEDENIQALVGHIVEVEWSKPIQGVVGKGTYFHCKLTGRF